jgi:hypothetical protein
MRIFSLNITGRLIENDTDWACSTHEEIIAYNGVEKRQFGKPRQR